MNRQIVPSEIEAVIKKLAIDKSPGPEGFGGEFYQTRLAVACIPWFIGTAERCWSFSSLSLPGPLLWEELSPPPLFGYFETQFISERLTLSPPLKKTSFKVMSSFPGIFRRSLMKFVIYTLVLLYTINLKVFYVFHFIVAIIVFNAQVVLLI